MSKVRSTYALDIETIPGPTQPLQALRQQDFERLAEEIEGDRTVLPADRKFIDKRLTNPQKIAEAIFKKLAEGQQLLRDKDALDPMTATPICVVCINMTSPFTSLLGTEPPPIGMVKEFTDIANFYDWARTEVDQFIGFNIVDFDIRVLRMHQAKTTTGLCDLVLPLILKPIDLIYELGDKYDKSKYGTPHDLKHYVATILAREAEFEGPVKEFLASTFTGADVGRAYMENQMDKILHHCTLDALMAALIAVKMGYHR